MKYLRIYLHLLFHQGYLHLPARKTHYPNNYPPVLRRLSRRLPPLLHLPHHHRLLLILPLPLLPHHRPLLLFHPPRFLRYRFRFHYLHPIPRRPRLLPRHRILLFLRPLRILLPWSPLHYRIPALFRPRPLPQLPFLLHYLFPVLQVPYQ